MSILRLSVFRLILTCAPVLTSFLFSLNEHARAQDDVMSLVLRSRVPTAENSSNFHVLKKQEDWKPSETAIIVCDMWDLHHCLNAVRRGTELAPRMNSVLNHAREQGAVIIHAPSSCVDAYKDHPARARAQAVPRSEQLPDEIEKWLDRIPEEDGGEYPIDQSDGGEDDDPEEHAAWAKELESRGRNPRSPWKSQSDLLGIDGKRDFISDDGEEIWSILESEKRENVILLGVHTNMCVLGRPFGLRQMAKNGKNVVLMRDMTDTMYNPGAKPFVSHFTGTDLIVEHIEKWVCPTITSEQLIGGDPFKFKNDTRPHLVVLSAEREYKTEKTLPKFALEQLGKSFKVSYVFADLSERNTLPGIDVIDEADVLLVSVRRRLLPKSQMEAVRRYVESGKPIIGIRTANHAFCLRDKEPSEGLAHWPTWDAEIFGGNYTNHYGDGPDVDVSKASAVLDHDILAGVDVSLLKGKGSLYQVSPIDPKAMPLLTGEISGKPAEPIAWVFKSKYGNPTFYTSLGHPEDFEQKEFVTLLRNAVHWAAGVPVVKKLPVAK